MVEKRMRNLIMETYHGRPSMTWNLATATRTKDKDSVKIHSHLVNELISSSKRPVLDLDGDVDKAWRVCGPV